MHRKDWTEWCRLCGKRNGSDIDVRFKFENSEILGAAIIKYFGIMISEETNCTKICIICHDTINSIIKYNAHATKVNQMFLEIETNYFDQNFDVESLREKYGLNNETAHLYGNEMRAVDFCSVHVNVDPKPKSENKISSLPPKYLKTEVVDVDELSFLEETNLFVEGSNDALSTECNTEQTASEGCFNSKKVELDGAVNSVEIDKKISIKTLKLKKSEDKRLECEICQKSFVTPKGRTIHMMQKHTKRSYKCNVCGKLFKRVHYLKAHEAAHLSENDGKLYDCPQCSKKFTREWYVKHHIRIVHKGDKPFICELCGAAFGNKRNMIDHHVTHSEEKKFKCPKCEKFFKCQRSLKVHIDSHNDTEYICPICNLKLNTKMILNRHMIVHSDKNKYKCNFCSKQFKRTSAFKNHLISHTGLKPYQCPFCDLTFGNGANCRKHQTTVHAGELSNTKLKGKQKIIQNIPSIKQLIAINDEVLTRPLPGPQRKTDHLSSDVLLF